MLRIIPVTNIRTILNYLGYPAFTDAELKDIFGKEVAAEQETITFKRLLVGSAECHYEKRNEQYKNEDEVTKQRYQIVAKGFNIVKNMFDAIDIDGSGEITKSEFRRAFISVCRDEELVDIRMEELDYNHDQEITFREFIYGISGWVGFADESGDDEDDEDADLDKTPADSLKEGVSKKQGASKIQNDQLNKI